MHLQVSLAAGDRCGNRGFSPFLLVLGSVAAATAYPNLKVEDSPEGGLPSGGSRAGSPLPSPRLPWHSLLSLGHTATFSASVPTPLCLLSRGHL